MTALALALILAPAAEVIDIESKITGQSYRIHLTRPARHTDAYPVVYAPDAPMVREPLESALADAPRPAALAVIGIQERSYPAFHRQRWEDLTPGRDRDAEEEWSPRLHSDLKSGGADRFAQALRQEIFPAIEAKCEAGSERHYIGFSFGGLFGAYALLKEPGLFHGYGLGSPSLWWNDEALLSGYAPPKNPKADVLISWGDKEPAGITRTASRLADLLRKEEGLTLATHIFEGLDHGAALAPSVQHALRHLLRVEKG